MKKLAQVICGPGVVPHCLPDAGNSASPSCPVRAQKSQCVLQSHGAGLEMVFVLG